MARVLRGWLNGTGRWFHRGFFLFHRFAILLSPEGLFSIVLGILTMGLLSGLFVDSLYSGWVAEAGYYTARRWLKWIIVGVMLAVMALVFFLGEWLRRRLRCHSLILGRDYADDTVWAELQARKRK